MIKAAAAWSIRGRVNTRQFPVPRQGSRHSSKSLGTSPTEHPPPHQNDWTGRTDLENSRVASASPRRDESLRWSCRFILVRERLRRPPRTNLLNSLELPPASGYDSIPPPGCAVTAVVAGIILAGRQRSQRLRGVGDERSDPADLRSPFTFGTPHGSWSGSHLQPHSGATSNSLDSIVLQPPQVCRRGRFRGR